MQQNIRNIKFYAIFLLQRGRMLTLGSIIDSLVIYLLHEFTSIG